MGGGVAVNRRLVAALGGLALVAALLRGAGLGTLALIGDESYYWLWSRQLDWAYYDHPAGVALLVRISSALGGQSEAGVRWLNGLLGVGNVWLTYELGRRMLSWRAGVSAAALVAVGAPYLVTSRFVYTDALHLFLLLLNLYCLWHLMCSPAPSVKGSIAFGLSLALLLNTKYSAFLYVAAITVAVWIDHRRLLAQREFWGSLLIGALGLLPVLIWNGAHDWASFRWQLSHAGLNVGGDYSLPGSLYHALTYLTWPLVLLAVAGLGHVRRPAERLLTIVALFLLLPVALSQANSPRNLSTGLVPLLLLAGARLPSMAALRTRGGGLMAAWLAIGALATLVYGIGTVANLFGSARWPHSSIVTPIRQDAAGWRELGTTLANQPGVIFALDYSIASQIRYYAERPAYTSWGQYRIWGIPDFDVATIVALDHLPDDLVSSRLDEAFRRVERPVHLLYRERGVTKAVRLWQAEGLQLDQETFLQSFDFLTLLEASR
jgi:4-amino-4-deoxy-L-arabinose transferase-like glycosyltransferase